MHGNTNVQRSPRCNRRSAERRMKMERPPKKYVCEKCGYLGDTPDHEGCDYLAWTTGEQLCIDQLERELALLKASPASAPEGWKWRRHARTRWEAVGHWDSIEEMAYNDMLGRGWDVEKLYSHAAPTPPVSEDKDKIIAAANALENIASTSSSTRIRRVANDALTAIRARRK